MITPIKTMTINQMAERKDDLLFSNDDIKEMARNVRTKAIDEFVDRLEKYEQENWVSHLEYGINWSDIEHIVQEMKAGGENEID